MFSFPFLIPFGYFFLRFVTGVIFLYHGFHKAPLWKAHEPVKMTREFLALMRIVSVFEILGGIALVLGLFTKVAALGLGIIILGALYYKIAVWKNGFSESSGWEFDLVLLAALFMLFAIGPEALSLDWMFFHLK